MKYCSSAVQPNCYLLGEEVGAGEREVSLEELQVGGRLADGWWSCMGLRAL